MDAMLAVIQVMYFPMLWITLPLFGITGLAISLFTHKARHFASSLLLAFPANVFFVLFYLFFIATFG